MQEDLKKSENAIENDRNKYLSKFQDLQIKIQTERNSLEKYSAAAQAASEDYAAKSDQFATDLARGQSTLKDFQGGLKEDLKRHKDGIERSLDEAIHNALEGVRAKGILQDAAELWKTKQTEHTTICAALFAVFVILIIAAIIVGGYYSENILSFIRVTGGQAAADGAKLGTAPLPGIRIDVLATTLTRVLLISLPIGMIIWVFRAILRIALLNLSLREDAAQRCVMIRTYVNLVGAGSVDDQIDRGLILSAIFRPLPGDQGAEIAPPSLADLIQPKKSN